MPAINICAGIYVDKTALIAAINTANTKSENDYTPNSWSPFAASRTAAIAVRDNAFAMQAEIDAATTDLTAKTKALVARANKTALNAAIATAQTKNQSSYTAASWAPFASALASAIAVRDNLNATQAQVDAARNTLIQKMNALVKIVVPQPVDWATIYNNTTIIEKAWLKVGVINQWSYALNNPDVDHFCYVGLGIGGADSTKTAFKTVVKTTFPQNIKKCTIRMLRSSEPPSTGGAPLAQIGTGVIGDPSGNQTFDTTYCTANIAHWSSGEMGWIDVDYTGQAKALAGQTVDLIFEPVDSSDGGMAGGYLIEQMQILFEVEG